ncbi:CFC_collapsed_G0057440.mRNA.1.CDS.1 [Saccharomyces cerevisiae]|nr:CFC_collapsed_G0057440.mRNA.1.CDS.1 [Saccharomyces cerevisiae]
MFPSFSDLFPRTFAVLGEEGSLHVSILYPTSSAFEKMQRSSTQDLLLNSLYRYNEHRHESSGEVPKGLQLHFFQRR